MGIKKSDAEFTEPFVGRRGVIVMLSVQGGQATASATELDYDAVHALEQTIVDLTFVADTPQTEEKHAICNGCVYCDLPNAFHPCASCVDFSKYVGEESDDTPQTDCDTCRHYKLACELFSEVCKYEPITQIETQNSNLTFENHTMLDCYNCKRYKSDDACVECRYEPIADTPQTDCPWK